MPDITKCVNSECPMKKICYRWTSKPSEFNQSYAHFEPVEVFHSIACDYLIDNRFRQTIVQKHVNK